MKEYDIIVAGGGMAGVGAAFSAARTGKKVLLVEKYGCLGGAACHNLVNPFMKYWRVVDGERDILNAGIFAEIVSELDKQNALKQNGMLFHEEYLKCILDQMAKRYGVEVLFHTQVIGATAKDGKVESITIANKDGIMILHFFIV